MRSRRHGLADGGREGGRAGGRWGQKRETKRDEAPEASCYATADLLTYISKQKQLAAGYWSASPTQHKEPGQKHTRCGIHAYTGHGVCIPSPFIQVTEADTKRLIIVNGQQRYFGYKRKSHKRLSSNSQLEALGAAAPLPKRLTSWGRPSDLHPPTRPRHWDTSLSA